MSHPFGDLLTQHLHRKHGLSQAKLAAGILQEPSIISKMCMGQRLTGVQARERVLLIVNWLHKQGALDTVDEANALLMAAGLAPLRPTDPAEAKLLQQMRSSPQGAASPLSPGPAQAQSPHPAIAHAYPLIARDSEYACLHAAWRTAMQGAAQFVCIQGDAGIGKTRLAEELLHEAQRAGTRAARTRAYALAGRLAYGPLADWLRSPTLVAHLRGLAAVWRTELARLLPELLAEDSSLPAPQPLAERWQRKQFFEALLHAFTDEQQPLLLVLDDVQWCDAETLEWLHYALGMAAHCKLLVIGTVREAELEQAHPLHPMRQQLMRDGQWVDVPLEPLGAMGSTELGAAVVGHDLDAETATRLFRECAGNPLFVIESLRAHAGTMQAVAPTSPLAAIPPKVYAVIASRLAQLSPQARALADVAAVVGRAFTAALLAQASGQDETTVAQGMEELWQRHLLREDAVAHYDFSHDRIRDVAYAKIGVPKRRLLHGRVAESIKILYPDSIEAVSAQLATHFEAAGQSDRVIPYVLQAIQASVELSAMQHALALVTQGLRITQSLPETETNIRHAIDLHLWHASVLQTTTGWLDPKIEFAFAEVRRLSTQINDRQSLFLGQTKLRLYHSLSAEWAQAKKIAEQNLLLAEEIGNPRLLEEAYHALARVQLYQGNLPDARRLFEQSLSAEKAVQPHHEVKSEGPPSGFTPMNFAHCLCLLGYPQQARQRMDEAKAIASGARNYFALATVMQFAAILAHMLQNVAMFERAAKGMADLARQYEYPFLTEMSDLFVGYVWVRRGQHEQGIVQLQHGIQNYERQGFGLFHVHRMGLLVEAHLAAGAYARGLEVCEEVLAYARRTGDQFWVPELHRLKGELIFGQKGAEQRAEENFCQAILLARQQHSKLLELRAAMSLARLWHQQGKTTQAHQLLAPIYSWFTEGFDTPDLVEAKSLLAELA